MERGFGELKRGNLEAAREAFAAGWARHPEVVVALSLAEVEMRLERFVDAAEHWQYVTMNSPSAAVDQRDAARAQLEACKSHVGSVTLQVTPQGSSVVVDDKPVGEGPLGRELFVEPGAHYVYATRDGRRSSTRAFQISAGGRLSFTLVVPGAVEPPAAQAVGARPPSRLSNVQGGLPPAGEQHGKTGFRVPVLIAGGATALAVAGLGAYFAVQSNGASDDAASARRDVEAQAGPTTPRNGLCAAPERPAACAALAGDARDTNRFRNLSIAAFVGAGALAAGTLVTMVLWKDDARSGSGRAARVTVTPLIGAISGLQVATRF
jgi:hypothetical protein